jgi:hypothetical protein
LAVGREVGAAIVIETVCDGDRGGARLQGKREPMGERSSPG